MKRFFFLVLIIPVAVHAQWHINLTGGFSNYSGDLQSKVFTLDQSYGAFGAGVQYDLTNHFSLLTNLTYLHIGAADKYNKVELQPRNLSFQTKILEWNVLGEYNFFDLSEKRFTPYVFAGLALYHFNPYAYDTMNKKVYLQPLGTEGEGLAAYPNRKPYNLTQLAIPFGAGIKLRVTDNVTLSYEISFRKLFTDYLDDVSTTYVDEATLLSARGPEAVEMAYRGNQLKGGAPYPIDGSKRGGSTQKDWYYFSGIRVSIELGTRRNIESHSRRGVLDCPPKKI
jgi:opacity protein-like surface antigen